MTTQQQQDTQPIKTIHIEASYPGEDPYDFHFFADGSLQILPLGDEVWESQQFLTPQQVYQLFTELGQWIFSQMDIHELGKQVRDIWISKKHEEIEQGRTISLDHLLPYCQLDPRNQKIDDAIGEGMVAYTFSFLGHLFSHASPLPSTYLPKNVRTMLQELTRIDTTIREDGNKRKRDRLEHDQFLSLIVEKEELMDQVKRATGRRPFWTEKGYSIYDDED